jgi:predicted AAA+ superfamily ATPase
MFRRLLSSRIMEAMADTPVVVIVGPRQAGKTTLVREIAETENTPYVTLDDPLTRLSAQNDPVGAWPYRRSIVQLQ